MGDMTLPLIFGVFSNEDCVLGAGVVGLTTAYYLVKKRFFQGHGH